MESNMDMLSASQLEGSTKKSPRETLSENETVEGGEGESKSLEDVSETKKEKDVEGKEAMPGLVLEQAYTANELKRYLSEHPKRKIYISCGNAIYYLDQNYPGKAIRLTGGSVNLADLRGDMVVKHIELGLFEELEARYPETKNLPRYGSADNFEDELRRGVKEVLLFPCADKADFILQEGANRGVLLSLRPIKVNNTDGFVVSATKIAQGVETLNFRVCDELDELLKGRSSIDVKGVHIEEPKVGYYGVYGQVNGQLDIVSLSDEEMAKLRDQLKK